MGGSKKGRRGRPERGNRPRKEPLGFALAPPKAPRALGALSSLGAGAVERLAAYLSPERAAALRATAVRRDFHAATVDRALGIVRAFISERGLPLFGGLAVHYSLVAAGRPGIYPEGERPDYDVYSPRADTDAYDLAERLMREGIPDVAVVRAIHVQTMKVRAAGVMVVDIGHAPGAALDAVPVFRHAGLTVVHPDFLRIDQHLAFCYPFNLSAGKDDLRHRWRKDLKRWRALCEAYPLARPEMNAGGAPPHPLREVRVAIPPSALWGDAAQKPTAAFVGFAAYAVARGALARLLAALGDNDPLPGLPLDAAVDVAGGTLTLRLPPGDRVELYAVEDAEGVAPPGAARRDRFLDQVPPAYETEDVAVYAVEGRRLAAVGVGGVAVATPAATLLMFLYRYIRTKDSVYLAFYNSMLQVLERGREALVGDGRAAPEAAWAAYFASPFSPTYHTIGERNQNDAYRVMLATASVAAGERSEAAAAILADLPPKGWYPPRPRPPPFDYASSPAFRRAGELSP